MRRQTIQVLTTCLLLASPSAPPVASAGQPEALTISQAIHIAQRSNLGLRQVQGQVELARIDVDRSRTAFYPSVSAQASTSGRVHGRSDGTSGADGLLTGTLSTSVGSSLNLFRGYGDRASLDSSRSALAAGRDDLARRQQAVTYEAISAFVQVVTRQEYVRVGQQHLDAQARLLAQIQEYQCAGKRPIADVYQQQAEVAAAELGVLSAERDVQVGKLLLLQVLGSRPDDAVDVSPVDVDGLVAGLAQEGESPGGSVARPDLLAQQHRVEAAAGQIRAARAGYLPSLDLSFEAGTSYLSNGLGSFADQVAGDRLGATLGLTLSVPLFDRGLTATQVEQAQVAQSNARLALGELDQEARVALLEAEKDFDTVRKQLAVAQSRLASAAQSLAALEERYRVGASTLAELSLVRAQHLEAAYDSVETKYALVLAAVAVRYQRGDLAGMVSLFEGRGTP